MSDTENNVSVTSVQEENKKNAPKVPVQNKELFITLVEKYGLGQKMPRTSATKLWLKVIEKYNSANPEYPCSKRKWLSAGKYIKSKANEKDRDQVKERRKTGGGTIPMACQLGLSFSTARLDFFLQCPTDIEMHVLKCRDFSETVHSTDQMGHLELLNSYGAR